MQLNQADHKSTGAQDLDTLQCDETEESPFLFSHFLMDNPTDLKNHSHENTAGNVAEEKNYNADANLKSHSCKHTGQNLQTQDCDCTKTLSPKKLKLLQCEQCDFKTVHHKNVIRHFRRFHMDKMLQCQNCDFKTMFTRTLKAHSRIHGGEALQDELGDLNKTIYGEPKKRPGPRKRALQVYKCQHCDYEAARACHLKRHNRKHTGEILQCQQCDYKTIHPDHLKTHYRKHTGEIFQCQYCDFKTIYSGNLKAHSQMHTSELVHCEQCDFKTIRPDNLSKHSRIHTGEMFRCNLCDFKTIHSGNLRRHYDCKHTGMMSM